MLAALAARNGSAVATVDVPGAYLEAEMPTTSARVHMRLDRFLASTMVAIDRSYEKFLRRDGSMVVVLLRALYGCIESALLWYEKLKSVLVN